MKSRDQAAIPGRPDSGSLTLTEWQAGWLAKRLCDVFDDELDRIAAEVGSRKKAFQLAKRDHKLVRFFLPLEPTDPGQLVCSAKTAADRQSGPAGI